MTISNNRASLMLMLAVMGLLVTMLTGLYATRMSLDTASLGWLGALFILQICLVIYCRARKMERFQPVIETNLFFAVGTTLLLPISYIAIRADMPLADDWLVRMDRALMFDWMSVIHFVDGRPWLAAMLQAAYASFQFQLVILPLYFALFRLGGRAQAIVFAYFLIVLVSSGISIWFPAYGTYVTFGVAQSDLHAIETGGAFSFLAEFHAVRSLPDFEMSLQRAEGILTFPSVHAAVALLCAWAAAGSRILFLPVLLLNVAMAFSAITHANHYLVDILAGFSVAIACIWVTKLFFPGCGSAASREAERKLFAEIRARLRKESGGAVSGVSPLPAAE